MKNLLTVVVAVWMTTVSFAQETPEKLYLIFEFMRVNDEHGGDYMEVEEFWSKLHKERIAAGKIIGWDLWSLTPSGTEQGSQYMTVTLFSSLEAMMTPVTREELMGYLNKAYPDISEEETNSIMTKTSKSRDIAHQVYLEQIASTKAPFELKVGTMASIDVMKQNNNAYETAEKEIFLPMHEKMVEAGEKGSWGLLKVHLPTGSEAYASHITVNMYKDASQMSAAMVWDPGEIDGMTQMAIQEGLESRSMREVKVGNLTMMVR